MWPLARALYSFGMIAANMLGRLFQAPPSPWASSFVHRGFGFGMGTSGSSLASSPRGPTCPPSHALGAWFVLQLLGANVSALPAESGGVAFASHVGGFVAGVLLAMPFRNGDLMARRETLRTAQKY